MSSSSSRRSARVLRRGDVPAADLAALHPNPLDLDLTPRGRARLDPARVDEAVEAGRAAGWATGYAAGEAAGREAASAAWGDRFAALVRSCDEQVTEALAGLTGIADATSQRVVSMAFDVVEAVLGRELALAQRPGADAVARALAVAPPDVDVVVHLHPTDAEALGASDLPVGRAVTVVADPGVAPGGCIARAGAATVDATLDAALARVRAVLEVAP